MSNAYLNGARGQYGSTEVLLKTEFERCLMTKRNFALFLLSSRWIVCGW